MRAHELQDALQKLTEAIREVEDAIVTPESVRIGFTLRTLTF